MPDRPIAFVQLAANGQAYSQHGAAAARGFELLGYDVRFFPRGQLPAELSPETVLVGGTGTVHAALRRLGVPIPPPLNLPTQLEPFWGRRVWHTPIADLADFPVFIKPAESAKAFPGQVVTSAEKLTTMVAQHQLTAATLVQAQELLRFVSEWRLFVLRGAVQSMSHYAGDPLTLPSAAIVRMAVGQFTQGPAGYAADFGITESGETVLVEVNDGFSVGHGGCRADLYARVLEARWLELCVI